MYRSNKALTRVYRMSAGKPVAVMHLDKMCSSCGMNHLQCIVPIHTVVLDDELGPMVPVESWGFYDDQMRKLRFGQLILSGTGFIAVHHTATNGSLYYNKDRGFIKDRNQVTIFDDRKMVRPVINSVHPDWAYTIYEMVYHI